MDKCCVSRIAGWTFVHCIASSSIKFATSLEGGGSNLFMSQMVMIMYVDGDLVQQSTTKMPREHNTVKRYFKFRQKSRRQSSKERHHSFITRTSLHELHPSNDFLKMSLPCDTSLYLSECKLQKFSRLIKQKQYKQNKQKTRKRHDIFNKKSTFYNK